MLVALLCFNSATAFGFAGTKPLFIPAPKWHAGEWWRVRTALVIGNLGIDSGKPTIPLHDSRTAFVVYHFLVLGQRTLNYEEQEGSYHVGQKVPSETCWVVKVAQEKGAFSFPQSDYIVYFRVSDLSLREVVQEGRTSSSFAFLYSGTAVNDDNAAHPVVMQVTGPHLDPQAPFPLWGWPSFPISAGAYLPVTNQQPGETAKLMKDGIAVTIGSATSKDDEVHQAWQPDKPWCVASDVDGLRESRLIETSDQ